MREEDTERGSYTMPKHEAYQNRRAARQVEILLQPCGDERRA